MMTIWKYEFTTMDVFHLEMPVGAQVMTVQMQFGMPCIWALVNPKNSLVKKFFNVVGTGNPVAVQYGSYVGTYQEANGALVWHLFENE